MYLYKILYHQLYLSHCTGYIFHTMPFPACGTTWWPAEASKGWTTWFHMIHQLDEFSPKKKSTRKNDQNLGKPPKTIQIPLCFLYVSLWFLYHNRSLPWHVGHVIFLELMAEGHNQKKVDHRPMFHLKILGEFGTSPQIAETKRLDWSREVQWLHASGESAP